jgi:hypothetical protein
LTKKSEFCSDEAGALDRLGAYPAYRTRMNRRVLEEENHLATKRFFGSDAAACRNGTPDVKTKGLLGLVASMRLCGYDNTDNLAVPYVEAGGTDAGRNEAMHVARCGGASISPPCGTPPRR